MSYPEPRYHGEGGEASGTFRRADQAPDLTYPSGVGAHYLASSALTGGGFGLYRWDMGAEPSGLGPHFHRTITESFFVVSGTVRLYDGRQWVESNPGDFLFVPEGGIHGFRNEAGPASILILFTPGAPREAYFGGLAEIAAADTPPSKDELDEFFLLHDNQWV